MGFAIDKQTLEDLNLSGKYKSNSIFTLFNKTKTRGGEQLLETFFAFPLTDREAINQRSALLSFFQESDMEFSVNLETFGLAASYLNNTDHSNRFIAAFNILNYKISTLFGKNKDYEDIKQGIKASIAMIRELKSFIGRISEDKSPYQLRALTLLHIMEDPLLGELLSHESPNFTLRQVMNYDHLLRWKCHRGMKELISAVYELDVYTAVGTVGREKGFSYAEAFQDGDGDMMISGVYHPCLEGAIPNDIHIQPERNIFFLTGANMAGKSTFMKSVGIAFYLAHMGFPLAVDRMTFTVSEGIYTSINVPDNLNMGYSHYYAEVLRVKMIAQEVSSGKKLLVIFDELFKGTNVKDAFDATVAVTDAFSTRRTSAFIVSTHIVEAGEELRSNPQVQFYYLPTTMEGTKPIYTYRLESGISADRHGMMIIRNEGIIDIIKYRNINN